MKESIFYSSLRAFFVTLLTVLGFCFALLIIVLVLSAISTKTSTDPTENFSVEVLQDAEGKRKALSSGAAILQVNINGVIGLDGLDQDSIRKMLIESREGLLKDDLVKGIMLYMQTPGGTVIDADGIYRAINAYKAKYKVPVYAYVDGMCASGGMYIACAADKILSSDVSIIGSVGVIAPAALNFSQLLDKIGVQALTLYAGKGKDDLNPLRPWKPGEENNYKALIDYYYNNFVNIVSNNRPNLDKSLLVKDYGAKVYPAEVAKELGYIDEAGISLEEAINQLAKQMGVEEGKYQVIQMSKSTWFNEIFKSNLSLFQGTVKHQIQFSPEFDPHLLNQFQYMYRP